MIMITKHIQCIYIIYTIIIIYIYIVYIYIIIYTYMHTSIMYILCMYTF